MSKRLPPSLPDRLFEMLSGKHLRDRLDQVILLITIDEHGMPYTAMLSFLEVVAAGRGNIRVAPWNNSTTTANMRRNPRIALLFIDEKMAYYVQATASILADELEGFTGMAKINAAIESILEDNALDYEGSASVTTGIRFRNPRMDEAYIERGSRLLKKLRE